MERVPFSAPFYKIAGTEGAPAPFFAMVDQSTRLLCRAVGPPSKETG
jgi:hypothetical protein